MLPTLTGCMTGDERVLWTTNPTNGSGSSRTLSGDQSLDLVLSARVALASALRVAIV